MKKALALSSFALSLALIAGPAAASPQQDVELMPATDVIANARLPEMPAISVFFSTCSLSLLTMRVPGRR